MPHADCAFVIGKTHAVCQDYAEAVDSTFYNNAIAILSDGCSGSPHTDIGARLLVSHAKRNASMFPSSFTWLVAFDISKSVTDLGLPAESTDATLMIARIEGNDVDICVAGDGVIAIKYGDGSVSVDSVEFPLGYPYYLSYDWSNDRKRRWEEMHSKYYGNAKVVKTTTLGSSQLDLLCADPTLPYTVSEKSTVNGPIQWVAIMSDGVLSFTRPSDTQTSKTRENVPLHEVLELLLDFTNFNGVFVQRQMKWFLKECDKRGWQHSDDLSLGAVYKGKP